MSEQQIAIVSFTGALKREIVKVKNKLAKLDSVSDFRLDIEISGRVSDGDVKIEFKLSNGTYGDTTVSGNSLEAITEEFLRRRGWVARNAPLMLTVGEQVQADPDRLKPTSPPDEIPF